MFIKNGSIFKWILINSKHSWKWIKNLWCKWRSGEKWSRGERLALCGIIVTALSVIVTAFGIIINVPHKDYPPTINPEEPPELLDFLADYMNEIKNNRGSLVSYRLAEKYDAAYVPKEDVKILEEQLHAITDFKKYVQIDLPNPKDYNNIVYYHLDPVLFGDNNYHKIQMEYSNGKINQYCIDLLFNKNPISVYEPNDSPSRIPKPFFVSFIGDYGLLVELHGNTPYIELGNVKKGLEDFLKLEKIDYPVDKSIFKHTPYFYDVTKWKPVHNQDFEIIWSSVTSIPGVEYWEIKIYIKIFRAF